jgi:hypothetical protein
MIDLIEYGGWRRNVRLRAGGAEAILSLDVGPRVLFYGFAGDPASNVFKLYDDMMGACGEAEWRIRGGHRFWTAPEAEHSYAVDNDALPEPLGIDDAEIELVCPPHQEYGFQKVLRFALHQDGGATVSHTLRNIGSQPLHLYPWTLSVMAPGGVAVLPQPKFIPHPCDLPPGTPYDLKDFLPNRRIVIWPYTDISDQRLFLSRDWWWVTQSEAPEAASLKLGIEYRQGWVAYQRTGIVFAKRVPWEPGRAYPDLGVNFELFTNREMLELETLAPAEPILPGNSVTHIERWKLQRESEDLRQPAAAAAFFARLP